jgi:tetratricopeptide (TPR) repeat protein
VGHVPDDDHPDAGTVNRITGGVFTGPVIQAGSIGEVRLPAPAPVALAGLPPEAAGFIGREVGLVRLAETLDPRDGDDGGSAVVVSALGGLPGVGKTALAVRAAHQALQAGWFPGGVLFVDLFGYDPTRRITPEAALGSLLRALGVPGEHIPPTHPDRITLYRSIFAERAAAGQRMLVVADNASATSQVTPLMVGNPHRVLVTSRHTLADLPGVRLLDVDVLTHAEALELVDQALRTADPADTRVRDDPHTVEELTRLCGHLPLALQVIAALLRCDPSQPLTELVQTLAETTDRLQVLDYSGELGVRAAFDLSYQHLNPTQARLFRLLSLNPGPQTSTEAAAALTDLDLAQTRRLLDQLRRAHLIQPGTARGYFRFHDLLRLYAADRVTADDADTDRDAATERLLSYYLTTAQATTSYLDRDQKVAIAAACSERFPTRQQALAWLDMERPTLVAAVILAHDTNRPTITTALPQALFRYFDLRKHWADWITTHQLARAAARNLGNRLAEGHTLNNLGIAYHQIRQFDNALTCHQGAVDLAREIGDRYGEGQALNCIGIVQHRLHHYDKALDCYQGAMDLAREVGDRYGEGRALINLGAGYTELHRFDEAILYYRQVLTMHRELGERRREGQGLNNLGIIYKRMGQFDEAITCHQQALVIDRELGDRYYEGEILQNLGVAYQDLGRFDEAITCHQQALNLARELGDHHNESDALNSLGTDYLGLGRFDEAITCHQQALNLAREVGYRHGEGHPLYNLGRTYQQVGRIDEARECWRQAVIAYEQTNAAHDAERTRALLATLPNHLKSVAIHGKVRSWMRRASDRFG